MRSSLYVALRLFRTHPVVRRLLLWLKLKRGYVNPWRVPGVRRNRLRNVRSRGCLWPSDAEQSSGTVSVFISPFTATHSHPQSRNVSLPGAQPYNSVSSLPTRFLDHGFTKANAVTLRDFRRFYIDPAELER